jgi:hypothetical protein
MRSLQQTGRAPRRHGVVAILVAFVIVILLAAAAFSIDVAYMHVTRSELQSATDAAARAATYSLGAEQNTDAARQAAVEVAGKNEVAGVPLSLSDEDIVFGRSDELSDGTFLFVPGGEPISAVQIIGRRTGGALDGPVSLFLGPLLGRSLFEPTATSVASRLDRDICVVVDRSGSMAWDESGVEWQYPAEYQNDPWWVNYGRPPHPTLSRWAFLVDAVHTFKNACVNTEEIEQLALVSYSNKYTFQGFTCETVTTHAELSDNYQAFSDAIDAIGEGPIIGGTNIGAGLTSGINVVMNPDTARPSAYKMIVLMTDGIWNAGTDPSIVAQTAAANNIIVHTITFCQGANQEDMIEVASITGGKHYHAPTHEELEEAFEDIAYSLPVIITQ